jgi:hypothetical protein
VAVDVRDHSRELFVSPGHGISKPVAFGEDAQGELYAVSFYDGKLWRIEPACAWPVVTCEATPNSTGLPSELAWSGSTSVSAGDLVLRATQAPAKTTGLFFHGAQYAASPMGNGMRCVGGDLVRLGVLAVGSDGVAVQPFDAQAAGLAPGATRHFQFCFRDLPGGPGLFNYGEALRVTFCP